MILQGFRITCQLLATSFHKSLRPAVDLAPGKDFRVAKLRYAVFATKAGQYDPNLVFRRILLTRLAPNVLYRAICCIPVAFA